MPTSKKSAKKQSTHVSKTDRPKDIEMYIGSGNVFKDIGFGDEESAILLLRAELLSAIEQTIKDRGWTQARTAKCLGVAQPRVAELLGGRLSLFKIDTLLKYLVRLGKEVTINVKDAESPPPSRRHRAVKLRS